MNKKILMAFLLICFTPTLAYTVYKDCGVRFRDLNGDVSVRPDDEDDDAYESAEFDTVLHYKDRIKTGIDSEAVLGLADKTSFIIKEKSILVLPEYEGEVSNVKMLAGVIWVNMKKMVNGGELRLDGTQAVAGVRGTALKAATDGVNDFFSLPHGRANIIVKETGEVIKMKPGQQVKVAPKGKVEVKKANVTELTKELKQSMQNLGQSMDNSELLNELKQLYNDVKRGSNELKNNLRKLQNRSSVNLKSVYEKSSRLESRVSEAEIIMGNAVKANTNDKSLSKAISELNKALGEARNLIGEVTKMAGYEEPEAETEETTTVVEGGDNQEATSTTLTTSNTNNETEEEEIDSGIFDSLKDLEADLTAELSGYRAAYDEYGAAKTAKDKTRVLSRSLRIVGKYSRITRRYDRAKKLYSTISARLGKLKSAESQRQELEEIWRRIEDLYSSLSNEADVLRNSIEDLQNQLNQKGVLKQ